MKKAKCSYIGTDKAKLTDANLNKCRDEFLENARKKALEVKECNLLNANSSLEYIQTCRTAYRKMKDD